MPEVVSSADNLIVGQSAQLDIAGVVDYALELWLLNIYG